MTNGGPMEASGKKDFLYAELSRQQERFARRRKRDKRKAFVLQMSTVALSAAITVLLGLQVSEGGRRVLSNVALALGAMVTVMAAAEAFFNHRGLWIRRTLTVRRLEELRRHVDFQLSNGGSETIDEMRLRAWLEELDQIIRDDREAWLRLRSEPAAWLTKRDDEPPTT
jgi:hypothetical protein